MHFFDWSAPFRAKKTIAFLVQHGAQESLIPKRGDFLVYEEEKSN